MTRNYSCIRFSTVGPVGWLEFNRPPVNAFSRTMVDETHDCIEAVLADPKVRVLVLTSAIDGYFSAGADLNAFKGPSAEGILDWTRRCHAIARLLRGSTKPLLAAIGGTAVGGGLEMALHCDIRFAASDAKLGQPEIHIGFIPPIATTQALARLIGRPRAIRYLYEGRMISAQEALDWDMVGELVAPEKLRERVQAYALDLAAKSPAALAAIRRTITLGGGMDYDVGMEFEMKAVGEVASGPDFREGVAAFLEKRPAKWRFES